MSGLEENQSFLNYWHDLTNYVCDLKNDTRRISERRWQLEGLGNTNGQFLKIIEEVMECKRARRINMTQEEVDENVDILFAWLALNHLHNYTDEEIKWSIARALKKFHERGWIKFL